MDQAGVGSGYGASLERARAAAQVGDFPGFLDALMESRLLDGLVRRALERRPSLVDGDAHSVVADNVQALWDELREARAVPDLATFLVKRTEVAFAELMRARRRLQPPAGVAKVEAMEARRDPDAFQAHDFADRRPAYEAPPREALRLKAIQAARRLLPRLGLQNVQAVMGLLIDAVEIGRADLPPQEIADALGLTVGTVKVSMTRGLQRLARIARQEGLADDLLADIELTLAEDDDEEEE